MMHNKISLRALAVTALCALLLCASPRQARATAVGDAFASGTLTIMDIISPLPPALFIEGDAFVFPIPDPPGGADVVLDGEALADGVPGPGAFVPMDIGSTTTQEASVTATADPGEFGGGIFETDGALFVENFGPEFVTVVFSFEYFLSADSSADSPFEYAEAFAGVALFSDFGVGPPPPPGVPVPPIPPLPPGEPFFEDFVESDTEFGDGLVTSGSIIDFAITIAPSEFGFLTLSFVDADALVDSPGAPVPEPATMLLLGFGLIAIAAIGRKRFQG